MKNVELKSAIDFHGHLGPYLVLGLLAGETALKKLKSKKYFGLEVKVWGATKKPKSCLIDGLQLSTGATYGKGNIHKFNGNKIKISLRNLKNKKNITLQLREDLVKKLDSLKGHSDSGRFAKELLKFNPARLFKERLCRCQG
jgi:formylmethanofuran dehydrogenase subunit E